MSGTRGGRRRTVLRSVAVKDIGPFRNELSLNFDRHWNLLLGDNGVGKSTILKAIAVALCGEDAIPYAERIVNRDSDSGGEIYLTVGEPDAGPDSLDQHAVVISRKSGGGVRIEPSQVRALDRLGWMALGFPALRPVTWEGRSSPARPCPVLLGEGRRGGVRPGARWRLGASCRP